MNTISISIRVSEIEVETVIEVVVLKLSPILFVFSAEILLVPTVAEPREVPVVVLVVVVVVVVGKVVMIVIVVTIALFLD